MSRLTLKAGTHSEKLLLNYLEAHASDNLADRINAGEKTLAQCWDYIKGEAKKQAVNGCACIDDATVFGWAIHFFEEDSIKGAKPVVSAYAKEIQRSQKKEAEKKPKTAKTDEDQISFDLFL